MSPRARIAVVGTSCTGKTTLAEKIHRAAGHAFIDLDRLFWRPGWQIVPREKFLRDLTEELRADRWVVSGNYSTSQNTVLELADTVIWLDYSFPVTFGRALRRTLRRGIRREECCNGNYESLGRAFFSRDSILLWVLQTHAKRKRQYAELQERLRGTPIEFIRLRTPRETERWRRGFVGNIF